MPSLLSALFGRSRQSVNSAQVLPPKQPDEEERRQIARRCAEAREEESRRIAGDLHDGPVQQLANLVLRLDMAEKALPAEAADTRQELVQLRQFAKDTLQDLRRFLFELRPSARDAFSLLPTLRQYCQDFRARYSIPVALLIEDADWSLESDIAANLFRVIQESLTNVRKHAGASKVAVHLHRTATQVTIEVLDDGRGFDVAAERRHSQDGKKMGLACMEDRVRAVGGKLELSSSPKGTRVCVEVMIPEDKGQ